MASWELTMDVDAAPEAVWGLVGDLTSVPRWYPKYVACEVEGDTRVLRNAEGGELVERILERDDAGRRYAYSVVSGAPVRSHRASFEVRDRGEGSTIVWRSEAEPTDPAVDIEARLSPTQADALRRMKELVEAVSP